MSVEWPESIATVIEERVGPAPVTESPGGMSGSSVVRLTGNGRSLILKSSSSPREWHVYTRLVPQLLAAGVDLPHLHGADVRDGRYWLALEDISRPLPRERWLADSAVLRMLRRLHRIPLEAIDMHPQAYRPEWTSTMSERALSLLDADAAARIRPALESIRMRTGSLFKPVSLISADPNPANWGVRPDGSPVLFDWERLTAGSPAIDLAITVPGLGTPDDFRRVVAVYGGQDGAGDDRFIALVSCAKVWSVIELLAGIAAGDVEPAFDVETLLRRLPEWIMLVSDQ